MSKNQIAVPFCVAGLGICFGVVTILVALTRGHPALVRKKLRLGALLLSLSGAAYNCTLPTAMCYDPAPSNNITVNEAYGNDTLAIDLSQTSLLQGKITYRTSSQFSYLITTQDSLEVQRSDILPKDGAFDEDTEEFEIAIDTSLSAGLYNLSFHQTPKDSIVPGNGWPRYKLSITRLQ